MKRQFHVALMALNAGGTSGVPRYTRALVRGLDVVAKDYPELALMLVTTRAGLAAMRPRRLETRTLSLFAARALPGSMRLALEQALLPALRVDLIHFFDVNGAILPPRRAFTATFHDAAIRYPHFAHFSGLQRMYKGRLYPWSLPRARRVVAVSEFARQEAIRHFGVDPRRIVTVRSGPGLDGTAGGGPWRDASSVSGGNSPYFLFVGNLTTSKNLPLLVRAFTRADLGADLVLAGNPAGGAADVHAAIDASPRSKRIRILHRPDDSELDRLYRGALALVLPSRYEGFGFPPLEAMARDCPVLASDIDAIREISGPGALLLPLEEKAWVAALQRVVADPALRDDLRSRGRERVAHFSWEETARNLCRVLADAAKEAAA